MSRDCRKLRERGLLHNYYPLEELIAQYKRQSNWSVEVLEYFWPKKTSKIILDVGLGPSPDYFLKLSSKDKVGVDIDKSALKRISSDIFRVQANSISLPFKDNVFDVVICHYLLLWVPIRLTLDEMWRVTAPGGRLICASEPNYSNRKEIPNCIKNDFIFALKSLGANPDAGNILKKEFALLTNRFETGILTPIDDKQFQLNELKSDIKFLSRVLNKDIFEKAKPLINALEQGVGNIYMPVHYGCAFK